MRVAYAKLGRSWNLDRSSFSPVGGDVDTYNALKLLATRNPQVEWVLIGRNSGEDPRDVGLPSNVTQFWTSERRRELRERFKARTSTRLAPMGPEGMDETVRILDDMTMPTWRSVDGIVVWAGQHGTSNSRILQTDGSGQFTNPQDSSVLYGSYVVRGITVWREVNPIEREEVWLCSDPRNYVKCRDLRWPLRHPVLAQFAQRREQKFERYDTVAPTQEQARDFGVRRVENGHIWVSSTTYTYDRLEHTALPDPGEVALDLESPRRPFGMVINENRKVPKNGRLAIMKEWVIPSFPECELHGKWTPDSLEELGRHDVTVIPNDQIFTTLSRWSTTFTTPASGSGWATAKIWECFLTGTVCFIHPGYDTQGHTVPLRPNGQDEDADFLATWLRVTTPEQLRRRVEAVASDHSTWRYIAEAQRRLVERTYRQHTTINTIERRLGLHADEVDAT